MAKENCLISGVIAIMGLSLIRKIFTHAWTWMVFLPLNKHLFWKGSWSKKHPHLCISPSCFGTYGESTSWKPRGKAQAEPWLLSVAVLNLGSATWHMLKMLFFLIFLILKVFAGGYLTLLLLEAFSSLLCKYKFCKKMLFFLTKLLSCRWALNSSNKLFFIYTVLYE